MTISLPPGQTTLLSLAPTDIPELTQLSDAQLAVFVSALQSTPQLSFTVLPGNGSGTFFSLQHPNFPPFPGDVNKLPVWQLNGFYLINDLDYSYEQSGIKANAVFAGSRATAKTSGPPAPGGGGGTNVIIYAAYPPPNYGTNLWIAPQGVSEGYFTGLASNTVADVPYQIFSATNLSLPASNWISEGFIYGSEATNCTVLGVWQDGRTNLFVRLLSWADDGSGLPLWWQKEYFNTTGVDPYADPAGDGWSNLQKFQNGWNPHQFYTPPVPQGLSVIYYASNHTAKITWAPSPGPVAGYTVYDITNDSSGTISGTNYYSSLAATLTRTITTAPVNDYNFGDPTIYESFQVAANYTGGSSPASEAVPLEYPLNAQMVFGASSNAYLNVQGLSSGATTLRVIEYNETNGVSTTNFLTATTNGLYALPGLADPANRTDDWWVQAVDAQDGVSDGELLLASDQGGDGLVQSVLDARQQLKQNLRFYLRAALVDIPFIFNYDGEQYPLLPANALNYTVSGVFDFGADYPVLVNTLLQNFVYNPTHLNADGTLNTGATGGFDSIYGFTLFGLTDPLADPYTAPAELTGTVPPLLATNGTRWLCSYSVAWGLAQPPDMAEMGVSLNNQNQPVLASNARNLYGLPFLSYLAVSSPGVTNLVLAGHTDTSSANAYYPETAQPQFQTAEYDFWNPAYGHYDAGGNFEELEPLPEQPGFSTTNRTGLLVASVGQPYFQVYGYAKLALLNGYTNCYGYLGQYFTNAYVMDDAGRTTTNTTGRLSPFGDFLPTQPGDVALATMPDVDTGQQGTGIVHVISLNVDANHDGVMDTSLYGPDTTSSNNPYVFWVNNNYDRSAWSADDGTNIDDDLGLADISRLPAYQQVPDYDYQNTNGQRVVPCARDLEDFSRLWLGGMTSNFLASLPANSTITLSWQDDYFHPVTGNPTIDLFAAEDADGGIGYLTNESIANAQVVLSSPGYVGRLGPGQSIQLNSTNGWWGNHFIWCGVSNGTGGLALTITDNQNNILAQSVVYIKLMDIKQLYERWTVGDNPYVAPLTVPTNAVDNLPVGLPPFVYPAATDTNTPYILFVHGWNMEPRDKNRFAESAFKRLYWQGYQGRFGLFRWPTDYGFGAIWSGATNTPLNDPKNFDRSESNAWASAAGLLDKLTSLDSQYPGNVYLMAHSMGNVVAGEALRQAGNTQVVNTYIAMQGAISAHCYDPATPSRWTIGPPDRYANYWTSNSPSYFNGIAGAGTFINFYNTNDYALNLWVTDQNFKPDLGYQYTTLGDQFLRNVGLGAVSLNFPANTYEIFAFADPARSYALGAQAGVTGFRQQDLQGIWPTDFLINHNYSSHFWHSAEFRSDYPGQANFWRTILGQNGFNLK